MNPIIVIAIIIIWLYILSVTKRAKLHAWSFMWGSLGLFVIMMMTVQPLLTMPLARCVAAMAGIVGDITGAFTAYFKYGIIFIHTGASSMTLIFFNVYNWSEKLMIGIGGFCYIMLCNVLRIVMICLAVHFLGMNAYYVFHTFIGRIFFYVLSVYLYFYVFTKPQIVKMKVGNFSYGKNNS